MAESSGVSFRPYSIPVYTETMAAALFVSGDQNRNCQFQDVCVYVASSVGIDRPRQSDESKFSLIRTRKNAQASSDKSYNVHVKTSSRKKLNLKTHISVADFSQKMSPDLMRFGGVSFVFCLYVVALHWQWWLILLSFCNSFISHTPPPPCEQVWICRQNPLLWFLPLFREILFSFRSFVCRQP